MSDIEQDREVFPLQILRPPSVQKVIAETSKLLGEMRVDRMSAHSSARPDPHESVLAAPKRADTPTPEGAHTPASEEVIPCRFRHIYNLF